MQRGRCALRPPWRRPAPSADWLPAPPSFRPSGFHDGWPLPCAVASADWLPRRRVPSSVVQTPAWQWQRRVALRRSRCAGVPGFSALRRARPSDSAVARCSARNRIGQLALTTACSARRQLGGVKRKLICDSICEPSGSRVEGCAQRRARCSQCRRQPSSLQACRGRARAA